MTVFFRRSPVRYCRSRTRSRCRRPATPIAISTSSRRKRCSITSGCASAARPGCRQPGDYFTTQIIGEPIVVCPRPRRHSARHVGGMPASRDAGGGGPRQRPRLRLSLPSLDLFARRLAGEQPGNGPHAATSTRPRSDCRSSRSKPGSASSSSTSMPPRRHCGRGLRRSQRPSRATTWKAPRKGPTADHAVRLELEGDVREQQRRLPRQQAASRAAARLRAERALVVSGHASGTPASCASTARCTRTPASIRRSAPCCRCSQS